MIQDILIPFSTVGLVELGDKTQLAILCLASQTKKYLQLLLGVMLAFVVADGLAILFGDYISKVVPINFLKIGSGIIFIVFGIITLFNSKKESKCELKNPFTSAFSLILISEMGDKTQIAAGLFAAQYNAFLVFIGVIGALMLLSILAVYMGNFIVKKIERRTMSIVAGILFILIGIYAFLM